MTSLSSPGAVPRASGTRSDLCYLVAASLLWGTGGLAGALLGRAAALPPLGVASYRLAGGGLTVLAVLAVSRRLSRLSRAGLTRVLLVGLLTGGYQACYFLSVALTSLAVATVTTVGSAPVLVLAVEAVSARRRPAVVSLVAIGLAVVGLVLLVGSPSRAGAGSASAVSGVGVPSGGSLALGVLLALVAAVGFGALALVGRRPVPGLDRLTTLGLGFTAGGMALAVVAGVTGGLAFTPSVVSLGLLAYLGWVPTALAYGLFFLGLCPSHPAGSAGHRPPCPSHPAGSAGHRPPCPSHSAGHRPPGGVPASSAAVIAVLEPVTATVLGVLVLGQPLGPAGVLGAALLCTAAVVAGTRRAEPTAA
jgi:drug/metabolite transporter, DME family